MGTGGFLAVTRPTQAEESRHARVVGLPRELHEIQGSQVTHVAELEIHMIPEAATAFAGDSRDRAVSGSWTASRLSWRWTAVAVTASRWLRWRWGFMPPSLRSGRRYISSDILGGEPGRRDQQGRFSRPTAAVPRLCQEGASRCPCPSDYQFMPRRRYSNACGPPSADRTRAPANRARPPATGRGIRLCGRSYVGQTTTPGCIPGCRGHRSGVPARGCGWALPGGVPPLVVTGRVHWD